MYDEANPRHTNLTEQLCNELGPDLRCLVCFGSGSTEDYIEGVSDLDYFIIIEQITKQTLDVLRRSIFASEVAASIDVKAFSETSFLRALHGDDTTGFFNGWALRATMDGVFDILHGEDWLLQHLTSDIDIRTGALVRAEYYLQKIRKILIGGKHLFHGKIVFLSDASRMKVLVSSIKCVMIFHLAHQGVFAHTNREVLLAAPDDVKDVLADLFDDKARDVYDKYKIQSMHAYLETRQEQLNGLE